MTPENTDVDLNSHGICTYKLLTEVTDSQGNDVIIEHTGHIDFTKLSSMDVQDDNHPHLVVKYTKDPGSTHRVYMDIDLANTIANLFADRQLKSNKKRIKIG